MISTSQIQNADVSSEDRDLSQRLLCKFAKLKEGRKPFYLTHAEFDDILKWKLKGQYIRQAERRSKNTDDLIRKVTQFVFSLQHEDDDYKTEVIISALRVLRGVDIPVASAVVALVLPKEYAVIDYKVWRQLYGKGPDGRTKRSFTMNDYKKYLRTVRELARELKMNPQEVDLRIWSHDKNQNNKEDF